MSPSGTLVRFDPDGSINTLSCKLSHWLEVELEEVSTSMLEDCDGQYQNLNIIGSKGVRFEQTAQTFNAQHEKCGGMFLLQF